MTVIFALCKPKSIYSDFFPALVLQRSDKADDAQSILAPLAILGKKKIPLNPINQRETYTHTVKENTHIHTCRGTHPLFPSLTHFLPDSEMHSFPTGTPTLFWHAYLLSRHRGIRALPVQ